MVNNQYFEEIWLPNQFREIFLNLCDPDINPILWCIFNMSRDRTDFYNILTVLLKKDSGAPREFELSNNVPQESSIGENAFNDILRRLKENGIWSFFKYPK